MKKGILVGGSFLALLALFIPKRSNQGSSSNAPYYPVDGKITSYYGYRTHPVTGEKQSFHNGIDMAAPSGTPIVSPESGKVTSQYWGDAGGNQMIVTHDSGYVTGYAHLKGYTVKKGQSVGKGEVIAQVGNTGHTTGAHLHFTVRNQKGDRIDPLLYLKNS